MASHRAPKVTGRAASLGIIGVAATTAVMMPSTSQAATQTVSQVKAQVNLLNQQAEVATNTYDAAKEQYATLQQKVDGLQQQITQEQTALNALDSTMGTQAAAQYRTGGVSATLELALSASPQTYLDEAGMISQESAQEAAQLKAIALDQQQLKADEAEAQAAISSEQAALNQASTAKSQIEAKLNDRQKVLNSLTATERAAVTAPDGTTHYDGTLPSVSGRAGVAVAYAEDRLGDPYGYGDEGPTYYDCSGLTQMAWAAAGVAIPRTSEEQFADLPELSSASELEPGDLIFFFPSSDGPSHVALYVGGGMYVQATHPGSDIIMSSLDPSSSEYGDMPIAGYARP